MKQKNSNDEKYPGYYPRPRVVSRFHYGPNNESSLIELDGSDLCSGSVFVEGLNGVGITSTVVSAYLVGTLKLPLVAIFFSPRLPAMCSVHSYRGTSPIRIYGNKEICVAVGDIEMQPIQQSDLVYQICKAFLDFARRHKCRHVVSIEAYPVKGDMNRQLRSIARMMPKDKKTIQLGGGDSDEDDGKASKNDSGKPKGKKIYEQVGFLTTSREIGEKLLAEGHKPVQTGTIIGTTGAMLTTSFTCASDDPPLTAILAPDPVQLPDQRGALLAVQVIKEHFGVSSIDTTELKTEAERLANKISSTIETVKQQVRRQYVPQRGAPPPGMYM